MEEERRINWLSLFIKIVIIFVFLIIIIWLISKIVGKSKISRTFINNINRVQEVSVEYFKNIDLPVKKGQSIKITLEELIEKQYITAEEQNLFNSCNIKESYSEILREEKQYIVNTNLKCGKEKSAIKKNFSLEDCKNCNNQLVEEPNTNNQNPIEENKTIYYEHVKETKEYTKWIKGNLTGNNIENKYEYYGVDYQTYYTLGVIPANETKTTYTLKLNNVPNDKYYFTTIKESNNFKTQEQQNYINEKNISIHDGNIPNYQMININSYSLKESNFTYKLSPYYRDGNFYIRISITLNNIDGVKAYYDNNIQQKAYLIPLRIEVKFASNDIKETKPSGQYDTITYYRYVTINKETIWSNNKKVEGYTQTGKTKIK